MILIYFILGVLFIQYGIPILDGLCSWFLSWIEAQKIEQSIKVNQANITMRRAAASADEDDNDTKKLIGFCREDDYEEKEDDEE